MSVPVDQSTKKTQTNSETKEMAALQYSAAPEAKRSSSLYYFIQTLLSTKTASALDAFTVKPFQKISACESPTQFTIRNAYIIEFPALEPQDFILKDDRFVERHLSVDEIFAPGSSNNGQHNFPYCHYTETYEKPEKKRIVLHVYINSIGKIESCKMKYIQTMQNTEGASVDISEQLPIELVNHLKPMALKNAGIALALFKKLNRQKLDKFLSLHNELQTLDFEMSTLFLKLHKEEEQATYLQLSEKFIRNVATLNALTDSRYIDVRDVHIKRTCLRIQKGEFNAKNFELADKDMEVPDETETDSTSMPKENSLAASALPPKNIKRLTNQFKSKRTELLNIIKADEKRLEKLEKKALTSAELIERIKIVDNLRDSLLAVYCLPNNPKTMLSFKNLEKNLSTIPTLLQSFETFVTSGNISEAFKLYPYIEHNLNISFLHNLICSILYKSKNDLKNTIEICNYLYDNSILYRSVIELLHTSFVQLPEAPKGVSLSLLLAACHLNNQLAFEMLLSQGANPNDVGLIQDKYAIPTMYAVLLKIKNEDDVYYVERLLHYGSLLEFPNDYFKHFEFLTSLETALKHKPTYAAVIHEVFTTEQSPSLLDKKLDEGFMKAMEALAKRTSALLVACTFEPTSRLINLLAPKSSLYGLLCSLARYVLENPSIKNRFLPTSKKAGVCFCDTQKKLDEDTASESEPTKCTATSMFLVHVERTTTLNLKEIVKTLVENLNNKYTETLTQDPKKLEELKEALMREAKKEPDYFERKILYTACLYLHTCNPNPTVLNKEEMLQVCAYIAKNCLETNEQTEWRSAHIRCMGAINMVDTMNAQYEVQLRERKIFQYVQKLLTKAIQKVTLTSTATSSLSSLQFSVPTTTSTSVKKPTIALTSDSSKCLNSQKRQLS